MSIAAYEIRKSQIKSFRRPSFKAQKNWHTVYIVISHCIFRGYFLAQRKRKDKRRVFSLVGAIKIADVFPVREPVHFALDSTHYLLSCSLNWEWIKVFSICTCFYQNPKGVVTVCFRESASQHFHLCLIFLCLHMLWPYSILITHEADASMIRPILWMRK